jgi:hypothetical protein
MSSEQLDKAIVVRATDQLCSEMAGEVIIFSPTSGRYYSLAAVGAKIWALVENPISVSDICTLIHKEHDVEPEICERDVHKFIEGLMTAGLIRVLEEAAT